MRRALDLGPPSSGKSTLARRLGKRHGLPVHHLDWALWRPGWVQADPDVFRADVARLSAEPAWIIKGNYTDTIGPRFARAETLIYLDMPARITLLRILGRIAARYGRERPDMAPGCREWLDLVFLRVAWSWNRERRARSLAPVENFAGKNIVLRKNAVVRLFLDER